MPKLELPAEVHECPKCKFRWPTPIKGSTMWCPNHTTDRGRKVARVVMKVVWQRDGGNPLPTNIKGVTASE